MTFWELFWVTIGSILVFTVLLLLLIHGSKYSVRDAQAHASDYGGVIKEGHGPVTVFLWVMYGGMFIWTIVYLAQHWHEFAIITAYSQ